MANIAVQRIKREFKEVLKSEEVCKALLYCVSVHVESKQTDFRDKHPEASRLA